MIEDAKAYWDTHCVDCSHDLHPMNVCSAIVGGDQNGPDYCPCAIDYSHLAAAYQRTLGDADAPPNGRLPCAVLIQGSLGSGVLIPGTDYRVAEVREHWEPSPDKGGEPTVSTVIRFDPR